MRDEPFWHSIWGSAYHVILKWIVDWFPSIVRDVIHAIQTIDIEGRAREKTNGKITFGNWNDDNTLLFAGTRRWFLLTRETFRPYCNVQKYGNVLL